MTPLRRRFIDEARFVRPAQSAPSERHLQLIYRKVTCAHAGNNGPNPANPALAH